MASISFEDLIPSKQTSQILSFDDLIPGNKAGVLSNAPLPPRRPAEFVSAEAPTSEANAYNFEGLIPKAQPEAQPEPSISSQNYQRMQQQLEEAKARGASPDYIISLERELSLYPNQPAFVVPGALEAKLGVQNTLLGITEQGSQHYQRMQRQLEEAKARGASPDYISSLERQLSLFQNKPEAVEAQRLESLPAILQTEAEIAKQPKTEFSKTVTKARESGNLTDLASGVYEGVKKDPLGALKDLSGTIISGAPLVAATVFGGPVGGGLYAQGEGFGRALVEETIKRSPDPEGLRRQIESGDTTAFNEIYKSNQKEIEEAARNQGLVSGAFGTAFGLVPGSKTFLGGVAKNLSVYAPLGTTQAILENKITQVPQINAETGKPELDANGKVILVDAADMTPADIASAYGIGVAMGIPFEAMHLVKGKGAEAAPATGPQKPAAGPEAPTGGPEAPTGGPQKPAGGPEATAGDKDAAMNDFMDKFYKFASKDDGMLMSAFEEDIAKGRITREEAIDRIAQLTPEEAAEKAKLFAQVGGDQVKGATLSREDFDAIAAKRKANRPEAPEAQPSPESTVETPGPESAPAPGVPLNEAEILKGMGYDIEDIVAMSPSERKAEVADAVANKVAPAPLTPEESAILSPPKAAQAQPKAAQAQPKPAPEQPKAAQTPPPKPTEAPSAVAEEMVKQGVDPLAAMKQAASGEQAAGGAYNRLRAAGYSDEQISGMTLEQRLNAPIPAAKAADEGPVAGKPISEEERLMKEFQDNWQAEQDAQKSTKVPPVVEAVAPSKPAAPKMYGDIIGPNKFQENDYNRGFSLYPGTVGEANFRFFYGDKFNSIGMGGNKLLGASTLFTSNKDKDPRGGFTRPDQFLDKLKDPVLADLFAKYVDQEITQQQLIEQLQKTAIPRREQPASPKTETEKSKFKYNAVPKFNSSRELEGIDFVLPGTDEKINLFYFGSYGDQGNVIDMAGSKALGPGTLFASDRYSDNRGGITRPNQMLDKLKDPTLVNIFTKFVNGEIDKNTLLSNLKEQPAEETAIPRREQPAAKSPPTAVPVAEVSAEAPWVSPYGLDAQKQAEAPAPEVVTTPAPSPIQQPPAPKVAVIKGEYNKKTKQFEIRRFDPEGKAIDETPIIAGQPAEGRSIVADFQKEHPEATIQVIPSLTPREGEVIVSKKVREAPRRTLRQYITYRGGINDVGHEVVGVKNRRHPGLVRTDGRGMSLEDAFKSAVDDGFYPEFNIQLENNKQYGEAKFDYKGMLDTFVNDLQKNEQTYRAQDKDKKVQESEQDAFDAEYESRAKERQGLRLSLESLGIEIDENILDDAISIRLGRDIGDYEAYELATLSAIAKDPSIAKSEIQDIIGEDYWNDILAQQEARNEEQRPYEYEAEPQTMEGGDDAKPQPAPEAVPAPREEGEPAERPEKKTAAEEPSKDIEKPVEPRAQGEVTLVDKKRVNLGFAEGYVTRLTLSNDKQIDIYREPLGGRGTLSGWNYRNSDDLGPAGTGWESVKHTYIGENLEEAIQQVLKDQTGLDALAKSPVNAKSLPKTDPEKTLVLIACGAKKKEDGKAHSLYNLYEGPMWQTLRLNIGDIPKENVIVLSAYHGLSRSDKYSKAYDEQLTPKRADEIIGNGIRTEISSFLKGKEFDSVIIAGSGEYRRVFYQIANRMKARGNILPDAMIAETTGGIGEQRGQFGDYLNQVNQKPAKGANVPESKAEPAEPAAKGKEIPGTGLSIEKKLLPSLSSKTQAKKIDYVLSKYFTPGNVIDSYGNGKDKVISFNKKGDDWSVTVQKVTPEGLGQTRTHRTLPDKNEIAKVLGKDYNKDWVVTGDLTKNKFLLDALGFEPMRTVDGVQQRIFIGDNPTQKIADAVAPKPDVPVEVKLGNEPPDQVGIVKFDQARGYGSVPDNQNVDYKGFVVMMKPEAYLALAKAGVKKGSKERAKDIIIAGKPIGSPFLDVDFSGLTPRVVGHDGRHRMMAIEELQPNVAVPVHIFGANGLRAKDITRRQIEDFKTKALNEDRKLIALFPNFGSYFHMDKLVEEEAKTKFIGNEDIPKIQKMIDAKLRPGYKARLTESGKGVFIDMPGVKNPVYLQIMEDIPLWIDGLIRLVPEEAKTPVAEKGAEGKPQLVIPGAEKIGMGELAQRKSEEALKPKVAQKEPGGLFGDDSKQADLMDIINKPEPTKAEKPEPVVQKPKAPVILNSFKDIVANKEQFSKSANFPDEYFNVVREWAEMLGMKSKIHLILQSDGVSFDYGQYKKPAEWTNNSTYGSNSWTEKEKISIIAIDIHPRKSFNLENLAHELGHSFQHEVWESSSKAEKDAVMADYRRFLTENKVKNVEDYVKAIRAHVMGKLMEIPPNMRSKLASKALLPYWRSFDEYFADQVAKYMMSEARPQSIIGKFFGRIADGLKRLYNSLAGMQGKARKSMKDYIERRMKTDEGVTSAAEKVVDDAFEEPITNASRSFDEDTINEMNELNKKYGMERDEKPSSTDVVIPESNLDAFRRLTQDEFLYQRRIQEYIEKASGAPLPEAADAYARVNLMPGRTSERMADLERDEVVPLTERMKALNISSDELGKYLYAHHALERNAVMAQRDPKRFAIDGGSGLADGAAKEIIKQFDNRKKEMEELADMVYAINKRDLERRVESGLYSQEQADELTALYKRYVPLRGFAEREADEQHKMQYQMGRGVSVSKKETESAFGRTSIANNPLMNVILQAEEGIYRVEKNRAARALLLLAKSVPNKNLWTVNKPKLHKELGVDGVVKWVVDGVTGPNTVVAKIGGVPYYIDLKHPGLAEAYKKIGVTAMAKPMRVIAQIGRFYSQLHTGRNPAFMAVNLLRDVAAAQNYAISVDPQMGKNFPLMLPKALKIAIQAVREKMSDEDKAIYDEWRMAGGKISYNSFKDVEGLSKEIKELLGDTNPLSWPTLPEKTKKKALFVFKKILQKLDKINQPFEDATRLAIYMAARKVKDPNAPAGLKADDERNFKYSRERAARFAQEATVNFYRRGKLTPYINGLYMFFNASLQGAFTGAKLLKNFKRARKLYAGLFPIGFMIGINNLLMSDDDEAEKGRKNYMNVPEWEKANSIVIKTGPGPKDYFRIPFPKWLLAPYSMGEQLAMAATGQKGVWDSAVQAGTNVIDAVNPFGTNSPLSLLSPTLLDPITDIYTNKTFTGSPIHPEPQKWNQGIPRSDQKFSTTSPTATAFSKWVYSWSNGAVDIYPGDAEYVYKWMFGGLGQNVGNAGAWANNTMDGKETKIENIPIIKAFVPSGWNESSRYYELKNKFDEKANQIRKAGKSVSDNPLMSGISRVVNNADKIIKEKREKIIKIENNKALKPQEKQRQQEQAKQEMYRAMISAERSMIKIAPTPKSGPLSFMLK